MSIPSKICVVAFYTLYAGGLCYATERSYFWSMGRVEMLFEAKRLKDARAAQDKA